MDNHSYSTGLPGNPAVQNGQIERLQFSPLEYQGKRVLTTERLAKAFDASERQISDNFANNVSRFADGVHFFKVVGDELRLLKNQHDYIGLVGKRASHLLLWTERGVARHAKILETDTAWEIYEQLEDTYFSVRQQRQMTPAEMFLHSAQTMYAIEQRQAAQAVAIQTIGTDIETLKQSLTVLDKLPPNGELITHLRKRVAKEFGLSFDTINKVMDAPTYALHPKFAVRNHHENAKESANAGYWKKDVNGVFKRFVSECEQVSPTMCTHPYINGRFRLVKRD